MNTMTPILPAHIEDTVQAIAELHRQHRRDASLFQRLVARTTGIVGRPGFVGALTCGVAAWIAANLVASGLGRTPIDPPPFAWLSNVACISALYITVLILITQRHDDQLSNAREQLTLELAILSEQKSAKLIALLEEMRRDSPHLSNRHDPEAVALAIPGDPQAVLDAIQNAQEKPINDVSVANDD